VVRRRPGCGQPAPARATARRRATRIRLPDGVVSLGATLLWRGHAAPVRRPCVVARAAAPQREHTIGPSIRNGGGAGVATPIQARDRLDAASQRSTQGNDKKRLQTPFRVENDGFAFYLALIAQ
jgi:hypothetical protein